MIFGWGKNTSKEKTMSQQELAQMGAAIKNAIADYGEIIEKNPGSFIDVSRLPFDKPTMKKLLMTGWHMAENEEMRQAIGACWYMLYQFQEGVGPIPISGHTDMNASPQEIMKSLGPYMEWTKRTDAERQSLAKEVQEFMDKNSKQR